MSKKRIETVSQMSTNGLEVDLLIVGAGIAGTVAALKAAKEGCRVLVVERLSKIGSQNHEKIDITENIGLEPIFDELSLPHLGRFNKSVWYSPSLKFVFNSKVYDYYISRGSGNSSFEKTVAKRAAKYGAKFWLNSEVTNTTSEGSIVKSVIVRKKDKNILIVPKFILGADGLNSMALKMFGFHRLEKKGVELIGYGGVCSNINIPIGETHVLFDSKLAPGGYFYVGRTKDGTGVVSVVVDKAKQNGKSVKSYYDNFCSENPNLRKIMHGCRLRSIFVGAGKTGILERRVKGNVGLIGDAGRTMDPIFGYGVRQAIISGYEAAKVVSMNLNNVNGLQTYEDILKSGLLRNEFETHLARSIFNKVNNSDLDLIFEAILELDKQSGLDNVLEKPLENFYTIIKILLRHPLGVGKLVGKVLF